MSNSFEQPSSTNEYAQSLQQLNDLCDESLSLETLRENIESFGFAHGKNHDIIIENKSYTFFLNVCRNTTFDGEIVQYILSIFPEAAVTVDSNGDKPLHHACSNENVTFDIIRALVEAAPETVRQATSKSGRTPLHLLCRNKGVDGATLLKILELLLTFPEADAVIADSKGFTPLHHACYNYNVTLDIIRVLVRAAPETVRQATSESGQTPLHLLFLTFGIDGAALLEILKFLLASFSGAAVIADSSGNTPLHHACRYRKVTFDIIRALVEAAPDILPQETNDNGQTPLQQRLKKAKLTL